MKMINNPKLILNFQTYNSLQNLENLLEFFCKSDLNIKKIFVTDNNSNIDYDDKILLLKKLREKYFKNILFVLNSKNYGIGGSQKIIHEVIKRENFDYFVNLQTSNRYHPDLLVKDIIKNLKDKKEYYLFSRFLIKENTKNYNSLRKFANKIFVILTKILTDTHFSDPGQSMYLINKERFDELNLEDLKKITNGSHFPHFFNIKMYNKKLNYQEIPIVWREGNIRSHLNSFSYPIILLFSLLRFFFTKNFFLQKPVDFQYKIIDDNY